MTKAERKDRKAKEAEILSKIKGYNGFCDKHQQPQTHSEDGVVMKAWTTCCASY